MMQCSSTRAGILEMPVIVFEIWTAFAVRSEPILVLNGPKYVILALCPIYMVLF